MKKLMIKSISLVLILILSALMMFSCKKADDSSKENSQFESMFPPSWTGGFSPEYNNPVEFWWVETYEEMLLAVEKLKSHGSTFEESLIVNYEGDLFDVKYYFMISNYRKGTEKIKFGDDPFDRYAVNVSIYSKCFFEEVTIDEINYGFVSLMDGFSLYKMFSEEEEKEYFADFYTRNRDNLPSVIHYRKSRHNETDEYFYSSNEDNVYLFNISAGGNHETVLTDAVAEAVLNNIEYLFYEE